MNSRQRYSGGGIITLIAIMPFHAFLAVTAGYIFGHPALWQSWKEVLVGAMLAAASLYFASHPQQLKALATPTNLLIGLYIALSLLLSAVIRPEGLALAFGIKTNLVFLIVFGLATLIKDKRYVQLGRKVLLAASGIVGIFAIAEHTILPSNFLTHFGYGSSTVPPFLVYGGLRRFPSTLGGPNQLGAFLILPIALTLQMALRQKKLWQFGLLAVQLGGLYFSYSRSAWLGASAAIAIVVWLEASRNLKVKLSLAALVLVAIFAWQLPRLADSKLFVRGGLTQNSSDDQRLDSWAKGARTISQHPLGLGLGSAGPASFHGTKPLITESYYLQIGVETGLIGLGLFLAITLSLASRLWQKRTSTLLAGPLLAALAGVSIVNLFLHGWADSTTALTYWSLAGLTFGGAKHV